MEEGPQYRLGTVSVEGNKAISTDEIRRLFGVKAGEILADRRAYEWGTEVKRLYERKGFVGTSVDPIVDHSNPDPDTAISNVRLRIVEGKGYDNRTIAEIDFQGNEKVSTQELLASSKYVAVGDQIDTAMIKIDTDRLRVLVYAERGYLRAHFDDPVIQPIEGGLKVTLTVHEGRQYRVGNVMIRDNTAVSTAEIMAILDLRTGEIVQGPKINERMDALKQLYGSLGYVEFCPDLFIGWREDPGSDEGIADLTFRMDQGKQYRIHSIGFSGVDGISSQSLKAIVGLKEGEIFNQRRIDKSIEILNRLGIFQKVQPEDISANTNERVGQLDVVYHLKPKARNLH